MKFRKHLYAVGCAFFMACASVCHAGFMFEDYFDGTVISSAWNITKNNGGTVTQNRALIANLPNVGWDTCVIKSAATFKRSHNVILNFKMKLDAADGYLMMGFYDPAATDGNPNGPGKSTFFRSYLGSLRVYDNGVDHPELSGLYSLPANNIVWHSFRMTLSASGGALYEWDQGTGSFITILDNRGVNGSDTTEDLCLMFSMYMQGAVPTFEIDDVVVDDPVWNLQQNLSPVLFGTPIPYSAGQPASRAEFVSVGDFNLDGKPDVAVANPATNNISILLGDGSGGFGTATSFNAGAGPYAIASGDFNCDGKPDLAAITDADNVPILLGDGAGSFTLSGTIAVGSAPAGIALGDFNNDGKQDLVVANSGGNDATILIGDGAAGFSATTLPLVALLPSTPAVGDFNRDGKQDLAVTGNGYDSVAIMLGNGSGGFGTSTPFGTGAYPESVVAGDFNADGNLDLAVTNTGSDNVSVLLGKGNGGFGSATNYPAGALPIFIALADFNGDGKLDISVANRSSANISILLGDGVGRFAAATNYPAGASPVCVAAGDMNRDGEPDLIAGDFNSNNVTVLLNKRIHRSATFPTVMNFNVDPNPNVITTGDFNRDGKPDIATANNGLDSVSTLLGDGWGTFGNRTNLAVGQSPRGLVTGDFQGDGKPDLATSALNGNVSILTGNGTGNWSGPANFPAGFQPGFVAKGDFNRDGKPDLAVTNSATNYISELLADGSGGFLFPASLQAGGTSPASIAVADFNRDGKEDLAIANFDSNNMSLLLGNGGGGFEIGINPDFGFAPYEKVIEDDFSDPFVGQLYTPGDGIGDWSVSNGGRPRGGKWHANEAFAPIAPASDGVTNVTIPLNGAWDQYIDSRRMPQTFDDSADTAIIAVLTVAEPPIPGLITLFGQPYQKYGPIDLGTTDFLGSEPLYAGMGGQALDFVPGASPAEDRLYMADETGAGGENCAFLTGANPTTHEFDAAHATLDYINRTGGMNVDPSGIVWVSDTHSAGTTNDVNILMSLMDSGFAVGGPNILTGLDRDAYDGAGAELNDWLPSLWSYSNATTSFERITASTGNYPGAPTKIYFGGVKVDLSSVRHYGYVVIDAVTNNLLGNGNAVLLDNSIGLPPTDGLTQGREFRGFASDGSYIYAAVMEPGSNAGFEGTTGKGEGHTYLYRYNALSFPDPSATGDILHPDISVIIPKSQIDIPGVIDTPEDLAAITDTDPRQKNRFGIACGRKVLINGILHPVFYVLANNYLYTLVPTLPSTDLWFGFADTGFNIGRAGAGLLTSSGKINFSLSQNGSGTDTNLSISSGIKFGIKVTRTAGGHGIKIAKHDLSTGNPRNPLDAGWVDSGTTYAQDTTTSGLNIMLNSIAGGGTAKIDYLGEFKIPPAAGQTSSIVLPGSIVAGDFNRDGKPDVAVALMYTSRIAVLLGDGSGGFSGASTFPSGSNPYSVAVCDFNADGKSDLAIANSFPANVSVLLGDGSGGFGAAMNLPAGTSPDSVTTGDFNLDGRPDIAVSNSGSNNISVLLNRGGQFGLLTTSTAPPVIPNNTRDDVLKIVATNNGILGDDDVELAAIHLRFDDGLGTPLTSAQTNAIVEDLELWIDTNGSGAWEQGADTLVATTGTLGLDASGALLLPLPDGSPLALVPVGTPKTYFVVLHTTANASSQTPDACRVTHVTSASSRAEDPATDSMLLLEYAPDVSTPLTPLPIELSVFGIE